MSRARDLADSADLNFDDGTLVIDSGNNRVGIGTTSPAQALTVASEGRLRLYRSDNARYGDLYVDNSFLNIETSNDPIKLDGQSYIRFDVAADEKMRITSAGNVGVGTSSPSTILHAFKNAGGEQTVATISAHNYGDGAATYVQIGTEYGDGSSRIGSINTGGNTSALVFEPHTASSGAWSEAARITSSGNVGIGTTSPIQALHVGTSATDKRGLFQGSNAFRLGLQNGTSNIVWLGSSGADTFNISNSSGQERMRIDSTGHFLFAKTSTSSGTAGIRFAGDAPGYAEFTRDGGNPLYLNRETSDGDIIRFAKDNSTVGSIGTASGDLFIGNGNTCLLFDDGADLIRSSNASGGGRDAVTNLGNSSNRFKDLYLSGGVYLGGTGSANKLDDYEEGTWTPTIDRTTTNPTVGSYSSRIGTYTVIGNVVYWYCHIASNSVSGGSGTWAVGGLPFINSSANEFPVINARIYMSGDSNDFQMKVNSNSNYTRLFTSSNDTAYSTNTSYVIWQLSGFYYIS